ncbi:hypothetical protein BDV97DRAFT_355794 [Delphinella strobiligena]|nr:hypothetical protein BDV97DRAFT_355794 [Delphinella strobiligena]
MATKLDDRPMKISTSRKPVHDLIWHPIFLVIPSLAILRYLINPIVMITNSIKRTCGTLYTTSDGSVTYRYQDNGKTCDTLVVQATIARAIEHQNNK